MFPELLDVSVHVHCCIVLKFLAQFYLGLLSLLQVKVHQPVMRDRYICDDPLGN